MEWLQHSAENQQELAAKALEDLDNDFSWNKLEQTWDSLNTNLDIKDKFNEYKKQTWEEFSYMKDISPEEAIASLDETKKLQEPEKPEKSEKPQDPQEKKKEEVENSDKQKFLDANNTILSQGIKIMDINISAEQYSNMPKEDKIIILNYILKWEKLSGLKNILITAYNENLKNEEVKWILTTKVDWVEIKIKLNNWALENVPSTMWSMVNQWLLNNKLNSIVSKGWLIIDWKNISSENYKKLITADKIALLQHTYNVKNPIFDSALKRATN